MVDSLVTLLTDFGVTDAYVGIMKGVMKAIAPTLSMIDLTHDIPPQDLWAARFNLLNAVPYFPNGTIHLAVVDPGVGGDRRGVAIQLPHCILVGPDNGIFSGVFQPYLDSGMVEAIALTNPVYWRTPTPSTTFHGRDIFAPAAAHLAAGVSLHQLGNRLDPRSLKTLMVPESRDRGNTIVGTVQYIDRFGNVMTNVKGAAVQDGPWSVTMGGHQLQGQTTYGTVEKGQPVALIGSHGWVEIAVNGGSAQRYFAIRPGESITVLRLEPGSG